MDLDAARERLQQEKQRLQATVDSRSEEDPSDETQQSSTGELSSYDQHPADAATETFEREKDMTITTSIEQQIEEIDAALERVESGSYGKCEECGRDINPARLEAQPMARFCIDHAEER